MGPIASLTGIRGAAALWVFSFHLRGAAGILLHIPEAASNPFLSRGWAGVDLFFILSGFILLHAHGGDFKTLSRSSAVRFAKLRVTRVYPLNWAVLLLVAVLVALDTSFGDSYLSSRGTEGFVRTALLGTRWLPGSGDWNQPVWSLSAEMVAYVGFPLLAVALNRVESFWAAVTAGLTSLAGLAAYQMVFRTVGGNDISLPGSLTRVACCFCAGAALARARALSPAWATSWAGVLSAGALVLAGLSAVSWRGAVLMPASFAALIFTLAFQRGPVNWVFRSPLALFLGRISFPLYLIHVPLLAWIQFRFLPLSFGPAAGCTLLLGYSTCALFFAWLLHNLVERPSHDFGRKWATARGRVSPAGDLSTATTPHGGTRPRGCPRPLP